MSSRRVTHSSHWGAFTACVSEGALTGVEPFAADPEPSPLLQSIPDALTADCRVQQPAIRRGWLDGSAAGHRERRGADEFVEVSWPEAIEIVARELDRVRHEHGNAAILGGSYGWSSAGRFHHAKTQLARFLNCLGGFTDQLHNYSFAAALALLPHVVGTSAVVGGEATSWQSLEAATDLWVAFGGLPDKNTQVEAGGIGAHTSGQWLRRIRASGTQFICVSPARDDIPAELGARWVPIRPGTDTALMLGIASTLVSKGWHDTSFLARYCTGYERFERYLTGADDGQRKDSAWAAGITGIAAGHIDDLAAAMAAARTMVTCTWSLQRAEHGEQPYWMAITLAAMLGQIGLPGGGFGFGYGNSAGIGNARLPFAAPVLPTGPNRADSWIPVARAADLLLNPGGPYDFDGEQRVYPDIRLVYWAGGNPFHHHQDLNRLIAAWRRPETIIVHEPWWTATARHADIVLPATTTLERNDIGAASRDRWLIAMKQAIAPMHGARNDFDIFTDLACALGCENAFTRGRDEMAWIRYLYERVRKSAARADLALPPFGQFWADGGTEIPFDREFVLFADFRADPDRHPMRTPSGRIEIFSDTVAGFGYDDCPGHPAWLPPREWLGSPLAGRYPLHLLTNQPRTRLHGQLDMGRISKAAKISGREPCRLNPSDAAARGIRDGDVILIANDRGSCLAGAVLTSALRPGVAQMATGAWFDPVTGGTPGSLEKHGNPNVLTADIGTSRLGQGPSAQSVLVEITRFDGDLPPITAFDPPRPAASTAGHGERDKPSPQAPRPEPPRSSDD
ncbi:MAG: molybdopterin-dependent oxidoreductase [Streptosporangiaceae bacterium]